MFRASLAGEVLPLTSLCLFVLQDSIGKAGLSLLETEHIAYANSVLRLLPLASLYREQAPAENVWLRQPASLCPDAGGGRGGQ